MNDDLLTERQAYLAMYAFLDAQYRLGWEELGGLLGSMSLLADGKTADSAIARDWAEAVAAAREGTIDAQLRLQRGDKS